MAETYTALSTIQDPATGLPLLAAWGDQINVNFEALIDPPACSVYASAVQTLANNTLTVLNADAERWDNDGMHSTISNTSRITIVHPGRYQFFTCVEFEAEAAPSGSRFVELLKNGTERWFVEQVAAEGSGMVAQTILSGSRAIPMVAGDWVEVRARHTQGVASDVLLNEFSALQATR